MTRIAVAGVAAYVALSIAGLALLAGVPEAALQEAGTSVELNTLFALVLLVFAGVGGVLVARVPANPIGWLFLGAALVSALGTLGFSWAYHGRHAGGLPGVPAAAWLATVATPLAPIALAYLLLLFPDGRPPSPRWRVLAWLIAVAGAGMVLDAALAPGPLEEVPAVANPLGVEAAEILRLAPTLIPVVFVAAVLSLVVRFRGARGVRRQQLKWLTYAAALVGTYLVVSTLLMTILQPVEDSEESYVSGFLFGFVVSSLPLAAGTAILRHRLYDIDVVINRTLVYGALTATLAGAYLALVLLLGLALGQGSPVAVAVATLAVAALFRPARGRIQGLVDRRFYRRRYDAARMLDAFAAGLRHEVELDQVSSDLRAVAHDALAPAHVSVWLR